MVYSFANGAGEPMTTKTKPRLATTTGERIWATVREFEGAHPGRVLTHNLLIEEMRRRYGVGASWRDTSPILAQWRRENRTRATGRAAELANEFQRLGVFERRAFLKLIHNGGGIE